MNLDTDKQAFDGRWKCHLPNLFKEVLCNQGTWMLRIPLQQTANILGEVAERAAQINDPILNELMCRLTLYEVADPTQKDVYNREVLDQVKIAADEQRKLES